MTVADREEVVIWHELECGGYQEDLPLWLELAASAGGAVLDIGAGSGRVALALARAGHEVVALDVDENLLARLRQRAAGAGLPVTAVRADARDFALAQRFALILVPMQTLQLLGGATGRAGLWRCARAHLAPGGRMAVAIAERLAPFHPRPGLPLPLPDVLEHEGTVYHSQPVAIRAEPEAFVLERRREVVGPGGEHRVLEDRVRLDRLSAAQLEREAAAAGLRRDGRSQIPESEEYAGSTVVILRG